VSIARVRDNGGVGIVWQHANQAAPAYVRARIRLEDRVARVWDVCRASDHG
jgi:hypothetical protein